LNVACYRIVDIVKGKKANEIDRFSQRIVASRGELDRVWKCVRIPSSEDGETDKNWTCTRQWSKQGH
jgi:hypothetical protein